MMKQYIKNHKRLCNIAKSCRRITYNTLFSFQQKRITQQYLESNVVLKLQIGSGCNVLPDWLNTDRDTSLGADVVYMNATKPLPFESNLFSYVYSEHFIEHIEYTQLFLLLQECYRVLKPNGKIRLATPDIEFLIALHSKDKTDTQKQFIEWSVNNFVATKDYFDTVVINNYMRAWGHKFIYDFLTLKILLERAGFTNIVKCNINESNDVNLCNIESHGKEIGEEFNRLESLVVEAIKEEPISINSFLEKNKGE
ncbi:MAG TPA: methyltransferase domain-containing protein [Anaerovoracaceae bacterium]|nr:methyltransferase domain-containing protein [Anaerovoracaceae bacterium]